MSTWQSLSGGRNVLAVVGPTASGKSGLAMKIAKTWGGEIICADSRTIYKGLDIGTAKPSLYDTGQVPHWGLDLVGPGQSYTAADFQAYAQKCIEDIHTRKKLPILVGGSGLYIDGVLYGYTFSAPNPEIRNSLQNCSVEDLQQKIIDAGLSIPQNARNKRYLISAIERGKSKPGKQGLMSGCTVVGLDPPKDLLKQRIEQRLDEMLRAGVEQEIDWAQRHYGWDAQALNGGVYKAFRPFFEGSISRDDVVNAAVQSDMALAKKQRTWFRRHAADVVWFESAEDAFDWLQKSQNQVH